MFTDNITGVLKAVVAKLKSFAKRIWSRLTITIVVVKGNDNNVTIRNG